MGIESDITNVTLAFPNWVWAVFTVSTGAIVFYLGGLHLSVRKVVKKMPNMHDALNLISNKLLEKEFFIDANRDKLIAFIKKANPRNAYDVQVFSRAVVEAIEDEEKKNKMKDFAFSKGLRLSHIYLVASIYLRDIAIEELGFNISDIDKHDPNPVKVI